MKRLAAASLWFLVGWYAAGMVAWALGLSSLLSPVIALATSALVLTDPRRIIWTASARASSLSD